MARIKKMEDEPLNGTNLLEVRDVNLVYRALPALQNINWAPQTGEQWACLGPNGSGKTSLARILSYQATRFSGQYAQSETLQRKGVAYVCFEEAKALCERDKKLDDSEFRPDATDPGTTVQRAILGERIWCVHAASVLHDDPTRSL